MSARAQVLRRNLVEFLSSSDAEDMAVIVEAIADELDARRVDGAMDLRAGAWRLLGFYVGGQWPSSAGNFPARFRL